MNVGAIFGLALVVPHIIFYLLGITFEYYNTGLFIQFVVLLGGLIISGKYIREELFEGYVSYKKIFGASLLILLFSSIIYSFYKFVLFSIIDPGLMSQYFEFVDNKIIETQDNLLRLGMSEDKIEKMTMELIDNIEKIKNETTPFTIAKSEIFNITFWGGLLSLITSIFMKREKSVFDTE